MAKQQTQPQAQQQSKTVGGAKAPTAPTPAAVAAPVAPVAPVTGTEPTPATAVRTSPIGMVRSTFDLAKAVDAEGKSIIITEEGPNKGKLNGVPANWDMNKHKGLSKADFADEATFLDYKASVADQWAKRYVDSGAKYRKAASNLRKYGNEQTRKMVSKLDKMRAEFLKMAAQLKAEGIEVEDIGDSEEASA